MSAVTQEFTDVACTACGCVCDDLCVSVIDNRLASFTPDCPLAERWFHSVEAASQAEVQIAGRAAPLDEALARAAAIFRDARAPLIYGLSSSSTLGQRAAIRLADQLGATIDTSASTCHGPSIMALQSVGESTCTLGEVAQRADLVVYWGSDPATSHPRHMQRYALDPHGLFVPAGRVGRRLIVVDVERTKTAEQADRFLQIAPESDFDVLWALRALVNGDDIQGTSVGGVSRDQLAQLATLLKGCRSGVFFFGRGLTAGPTAHANVEALLELTRELNAFTRFYARRMRVYGDVAGADMVLCWQTGYPFSVNLARGYPRYNPGEYSADGLLTRGEIDRCLLVGTDGVDTLSSAAQHALANMPTVLVGHAKGKLSFTPTVSIPTAIYGIHRAGTAYRMDEVPVPLRAILSSPLPTDAEVIERLGALASTRQ